MPRDKSDPTVIGEVIRRIQGSLRREGPVDVGTCRAKGCDEPANGLDGFCIPCSRDREREGKWSTRRMV